MPSHAKGLFPVQSPWGPLRYCTSSQPVFWSHQGPGPLKLFGDFPPFLGVTRHQFFIRRVHLRKRCWQATEATACSWHGEENALSFVQDLLLSSPVFMRWNHFSNQAHTQLARLSFCSRNWAACSNLYQWLLQEESYSWSLWLFLFCLLQKSVHMSFTSWIAPLCTKKLLQIGWKRVAKATTIFEAKEVDQLQQGLEPSEPWKYADPIPWNTGWLIRIPWTIFNYWVS